MSDTPGSPTGRLDPAEAFAQLGRVALSEHDMQSALQLVADLAKRTLPGVSEVSVTLVSPEGASTVAFTGDLAVDVDESQYERGHGPCLDAAEGSQLMHVRDTATEDRWPDYGEVARKAGVGSSLSVPVPLQQQVAAALNAYSLQVDAFEEEDVELAQTFASYAGVVIANMHLYESTRQLADQMDQAMRSRAVIEQAKGVLMGQRGLTASAAFDLLVHLSQHSNRKLREVAQAVVDAAADGRTLPDV